MSTKCREHAANYKVCLESNGTLHLGHREIFSGSNGYTGTDLDSCVFFCH